MFNCTGKRRAKPQTGKPRVAGVDARPANVPVRTDIPEAPADRDEIVKKLQQEVKKKEVAEVVEEPSTPEATDAVAVPPCKEEPAIVIPDVPVTNNVLECPTANAGAGLDTFPSFEAFLQEQAQTTIGNNFEIDLPKTEFDIDMPKNEESLTTPMLKDSGNLASLSQFQQQAVPNCTQLPQPSQSKEELHGQGVEGYLNWGKHIWDWDPNLPSLASETNKAAEITLASVSGGAGGMSMNWEVPAVEPDETVMSQIMRNGSPQFNFNGLDTQFGDLPGVQAPMAGSMDIGDAENIPGGLQKPPALVIPELSSGAQPAGLFRSVPTANLGPAKLGYNFQV